MKELEQVIKRRDLESFAQYAKHIWVEEPEGVPRVVQKLPGRIQRLKQLGNSVVPQIPEFLGHCILIYEDEKKKSAK